MLVKRSNIALARAADAKPPSDIHSHTSTVAQTGPQHSQRAFTLLHPREHVSSRLPTLPDRARNRLFGGIIILCAFVFLAFGNIVRVIGVKFGLHLEAGSGSLACWWPWLQSCIALLLLLRYSLLLLLLLLPLLLLLLQFLRLPFRRRECNLVELVEVI